MFQNREKIINPKHDYTQLKTIINIYLRNNKHLKGRNLIW